MQRRPTVIARGVFSFQGICARTGSAIFAPDASGSVSQADPRILRQNEDEAENQPNAIPEPVDHDGHVDVGQQSVLHGRDCALAYRRLQHAE